VAATRAAVAATRAASDGAGGERRCQERPLLGGLPADPRLVAGFHAQEAHSGVFGQAPGGAATDERREFRHPTRQERPLLGGLSADPRLVAGFHAQDAYSGVFGKHPAAERQTNQLVTTPQSIRRAPCSARPPPRGATLQPRHLGPQIFYLPPGWGPFAKAAEEPRIIDASTPPAVPWWSWSPTKSSAPTGGQRGKRRYDLDARSARGLVASRPRGRTAARRRRRWARQASRSQVGVRLPGRTIPARAGSAPRAPRASIPPGSPSHAQVMPR
jgi:hypothetical protein